MKISFITIAFIGSAEALKIGLELEPQQTLLPETDIVSYEDDPISIFALHKMKMDYMNKMRPILQKAAKKAVPIIHGMMMAKHAQIVKE